MRVAVVSDIHSNWEAFSAVLQDADTWNAQALWCLGDLLGYGPDPYRCWMVLADADFPRWLASPGAWVAGNHDWGMLGLLKSAFFVEGIKGLDGPTLAGDFGRHAWQVILKQREALRHTAVMDTIARLPLLASPVPGVYLFHGAYLREPRDIIGTYTRVPEWAERSLTNLRSFAADPQAFAQDGVARFASQGWAQPLLMLAGHTHRACAWQPRDGNPGEEHWIDHTPYLEHGFQVGIEDLEHRPLFANPGSVGFSRDCRAGLASYMLVDWGPTGVRLWLRWVEYDPTPTIAKMRAMGTNSTVIQQLEPPRPRGGIFGDAVAVPAVFPVSHREEKAR